MNTFRFGQNFRFGYFNLSPQQRMRLIKQAGFDGVMIWWGDSYADTDGDKKNLIVYAKDNQLDIHNLHSCNDKANDIWDEGQLGRDSVKLYADVIEACNKCGAPSFVMHLTRGTSPRPYTQAGLRNIKKVCDIAEQNGVYIAIENTRFLQYNDFVYSNINSPMLKFCFDSGHAHCYTPEADVLSKYGDKLVTMHLHDNYGADGLGEGDLHQLIGDGDIDFVNIAARLTKLGATTINLESANSPMSQYGKLTAEEYLTLSINKLKGLFK